MDRRLINNGYILNNIYYDLNSEVTFKGYKKDYNILKVGVTQRHSFFYGSSRSIDYKECSQIMINDDGIIPPRIYTKYRVKEDPYYE
jgi:hypothetical protein